MNSRVKLIPMESKLIPKAIVKGKRHESQRPRAKNPLASQRPRAKNPCTTPYKTVDSVLLQVVHLNTKRGLHLNMKRGFTIETIKHKKGFHHRNYKNREN